MIKNKYGTLEYPPGSTARPYYDQEGNEVTLLKLVNMEPSWAASRLRHMDKIAYNLLDMHINPDQYSKVEKEQLLELAAKNIGFKQLEDEAQP